MADLNSKRPTYAAEAIPSDIDRAVFLGNPLLDNMMSSMIAMGTEMWAMKRRMKVMEAVMAKNGVTSEMLETYVPTAEEEAAWKADRDRFIELVYGPLAREGDLKVSSDFTHRSSN